MDTDCFEIELESKIDSLPVITDFVDNALAHFGVGPDDNNKIQLAIDEACTNVIKHAYAGAGGPLHLSLKLTGEDILITIGDKGAPFDPTSVPPPDIGASLEERKIGGLGIFFMKKLMDSVHYSFSSVEGNRLTLRKRISGSSSIKGEVS